MSITYYEQNDGINLMAKLLFEEKLTPIIGAGFSRKCRSKGAEVPDGNQTKCIMRKIISEYREINLVNADFNKTAEHFFAVVPKERQWDFFETYFSKVNLSQYLFDFIALPWPYIYTLNIDDGIENSGIYTPVLPYQNANLPNTSMRLVYKLHGDATHEALYKVKKNIVFSTSQYIEFLTSESNKTIYNSISGDYAQKNLLFIGCSLENEPDLKYIYSHMEEDISPNILRCIIRNRRLDQDEEINLELYGINAVIVVNDYELFYREFVREYEALAAQEHGEKYPFTNPKTIIFKRDDKLVNIKYFSGENIFDTEKNIFYKSNLQITRACVDNIEKYLSKNSSVIIRGRRFSGKTFLLSTLAERYKKYTVLYFPSDYMVDEATLHSILKDNKDTLFLFDSNSLSNYAYQLVAHSEDILKENNNKLIVAINSNDTYLSDTLNTEIIFLPSVFNASELESINPACDKYGLIKRKSKETNIDYLKKLSVQQRIEFPIFKSLPQNFCQREIVLLILLCVRDKIYLSDITALDIHFQDVDSFVERLKGVVERVPVAKGERNCHSSEKLVHNSKYYLLSIMKDISDTEIIDAVKYIVSKLSKDKTRKRMYIETVLFDTLNQLFGYAKGAGTLIVKIYDEIEPYLNQDMDYWLQRAKSIYRIYPDNYKKLKIAYQYSKKSACDGDSRIRAKADLTTSLICCLLARVSRDSHDKCDYEIEAINSAQTAITSEYFKLNRKNLKGELGVGRRESYYEMIINICNKHNDPAENLQVAWNAESIKKDLFSLSRDE